MKPIHSQCFQSHRNTDRFRPLSQHFSEEILLRTFLIYSFQRNKYHFVEFSTWFIFLFYFSFQYLAEVTLFSIFHHVPEKCYRRMENAEDYPVCFLSHEREKKWEKPVSL